MCSPHLQSGLNDSKVLSQCVQGKGSGGKCVAVRRPRLAVAIVACVSVSSLPISLSLSLSLSLHPVVGCSRKKESHVTKLLIVECDGLVYCSSFSHFQRGRNRRGRRPYNGGCAFVTMFTQIFKDNPTISKGLLCNFSSHFIVPAAGNREEEKK